MKRWKFLFCSLVFLGICLCVSAQESFEEWKKNQQEAFEGFLSEEDKQFHEFLKKEWEEFEAFKAMVRDRTPKPKVIPKAPMSEKRERTTEHTTLEPVKIDATIPSSDPGSQAKTTTGASDTTDISDAAEALQVEFFDSTLQLSTDANAAKKIDLDISPPFTSEKFSRAWGSMANWDVGQLVQDFRRYKRQLTLNDWGLFLLINKTAGTISSEKPTSEKPAGKNENKTTLLTWYLLIKSGYECRVCYTGDTIYLMLPVKNRLYGVIYYYFDTASPSYYLFRNSEPAKGISSFYTYQGEYPRNLDHLTMDFEGLPRLSDRLTTKTASFSFKGRPYEITYEINESMISFGALYPQTEMPVYFHSPVSTEAKHSLLSGLRLIVTDMEEKEAVDFLLRFVQTGFEYQTDDEQFGREKPMFLEETLYYPYSDCEDRSVLFAYLVRELLDLDVVGLEFPGHIATAVKFSRFVPGDGYKIGGERYVVCDPTYINADAGMSMPLYGGKSPNVIGIEK